jgi:hypothetical protein
LSFCICDCFGFSGLLFSDGLLGVLDDFEFDVSFCLLEGFAGLADYE